MDLEKLVKSTFENYEADVDPAVWNHIEKNTGNAPADGSVKPGSPGGSLLKTISAHQGTIAWVAAFGGRKPKSC